MQKATKHIGNQLRIAGVAALVVMSITAGVLPLSLRWLNDTRGQRNESELRIQGLARVEQLVVDAETGQRGFIITGQDNFLEPYHMALGEIPQALDNMLAQYRQHDAERRKAVEQLAVNARARLERLGRGVTMRRTGGYAAIAPVIAAGAGKNQMDDLRRTVVTLKAFETQHLHRLDQELSSKIARAIMLSLGTTVLTLLLLAYLGREVWRAVLAREKSSLEVAASSAKLERGMEALRVRNTEISTLGEMARLLQAEMSLVEALEVTSLYCGRLLTRTSGTIYLIRNSADLMERAGDWGPEPPAADTATLEPHSCWALRRGQIHRSIGGHELRCRHYSHEEQFNLCVPLSAYGEVMGLLHVASSSSLSLDEAQEIQAMALTISEQVALSLANAKLRQVMRDQSIKDPLTDLYNRRYLEETLSREIARAQRQSTALSVVAIDLDHFKKVNDTYGHPMGDAVLRSVALQLRRSVRATDIACRYGGEEFLLILPDCNEDMAMEKALSICDQVRGLRFKDGPPQVTASLGVASFPHNGHDTEALMQAVDAALYSAKRSGRDRVVRAGDVALHAQQTDSASSIA